MHLIIIGLSDATLNEGPEFDRIRTMMDPLTGYSMRFGYWGYLQKFALNCKTAWGIHVHINTLFQKRMGSGSTFF